MQKHDFNDMSFCLLGLRDIIANGHVAAWYEADGTLRECEYWPDTYPDSPRSIPENWHRVRENIRRWGKTMRHPGLNDVAQDTSSESAGQYRITTNKGECRLVSAAGGTLVGDAIERACQSFLCPLRSIERVELEKGETTTVLFDAQNGSYTYSNLCLLSTARR